MSYQLHIDINRIICLALYSYENPVKENTTAHEIISREQDATQKYLNNNIFHAKVSALTALIMGIIEKHNNNT